MKRSGVRPSVCLTVSLSHQSAGLLLSAVRGKDIDRQRQAARQQQRCSLGPQHGAQQQMRAVSC